MRANVMQNSAMQPTDNVYYLPRRPKRAVAVARMQHHRSYEFLKAGFYMVGGALIGFALAHLPLISTALATALTVLPPHAI